MIKKEKVAIPTEDPGQSVLVSSRQGIFIVFFVYIYVCFGMIVVCMDALFVAVCCVLCVRSFV